MNIREILACSAPGDALRENRHIWPKYLYLGETLSAGPFPYHSGSILDHLCRCMNETAGDPLAVWMAMAHDCGKLTTPVAMIPHHYGHELRGEKMAKIWAQELGLDEKYANAGKFCAYNHMRAGLYQRMRPSKQYNLLTFIDSRPEAESFWKVVDADTKSKISLDARMDLELIEDARKKGMTREEQIRQLAKNGQAKKN